MLGQIVLLNFTLLLLLFHIMCIYMSVRRFMCVSTSCKQPKGACVWLLRKWTLPSVDSV